MSTAMRVRVSAILPAILTIAATACTDAKDANDAAPPSSSPDASADCGERDNAFLLAFRGFDGQYRRTPICVADVGPGLDSPDLGAEFSSVAAGEVWNTSVQGGKELLVLAAFVGTLKSGDGATWVAQFLSRLGADAAHGTVKTAGHTVQFIDLTPNGPRGFAYGEGKTVVIAYIRPPLGPPSHALTPLKVDSVFTKIIENNTPNPVPNDPFKNTSIDRYPLARGNFTSPTDLGWVFFRSDDDGTVPIFCGMRPDGGMVGCDIDFTSERAPAGTNQIILDSSGLHYAQSDEPTFTRPGVDVAWIGERIENGPAVCAMTDQAPMVCRVVGNGSVFTGTFR